jgi:hypothetical protein
MIDRFRDCGKCGDSIVSLRTSRESKGEMHRIARDRTKSVEEFGI